MSALLRNETPLPTHLEYAVCALAVKHDVLWLDVHVGHTQAMDVSQVLQQAARDLGCCCLCKRCALADVLKQLTTWTTNMSAKCNRVTYESWGSVNGALTRIPVPGNICSQKEPFKVPSKS
jgi:hypothetical protein